MNYVFNINLPASSGTIGAIASVVIPWLSDLAKRLFGGTTPSAEQVDEKKATKEKNYNKRSLIFRIVLTLAGLIFAALIYFKGDAITFSIPAFMQVAAFPSLGNLAHDAWESIYAAMLILFFIAAVYAVFLGLKNKKIFDTIFTMIRLFWSSMPLLLIFIFFGLDPFIGAAVSFAIIAVVHMVIDERIDNLSKRLKEKEDKYNDCEDIEEANAIATKYNNLNKKHTQEFIFFNSFTLFMYFLAFVFILVQVISNKIIPVFFSKSFWQGSFNNSDFTFLETCLQQFVLAFLLSLVRGIHYFITDTIPKIKKEDSKFEKTYHVVYSLRFTFHELLFFGTIGSLLMQLLKFYAFTSMVSIGVGLLAFLALDEGIRFEYEYKAKKAKAKKAAEQS